MSNQEDINSLLSSFDKVLHFSAINKVENLDAHIEDVVQFINNHESLKIVVVDEPLAIEDEKKKKKIYNAFSRKPGLTKLEIYADQDDDRFSLDLSIALFVVQVLCDVESLKSLYIGGVALDNEAAEIVARQLRRNRTLKEFWLEKVNENNGGDASNIIVQAVVRALRFRASLTSLFVNRCALSEATYAAVAEALQLAHSSLETLDIGFT